MTDNIDYIASLVKRIKDLEIELQRAYATLDKHGIKLIEGYPHDEESRDWAE